MANDRSVVIRRRMAVPLRHVYQAHTEARHIKRWFGPEGWPVTQCEMDFRVGGTWRMVMSGPDGQEGPPFGGRFLDIVPERRIAYTDAFEDGKGGAMNLASRGHIVFTYDFQADGEATEVTLTLEFSSVAMKDEYLGIGMREGLASSHDQWEAVAGDLARG
jgi:uncharacterized protein YndB with AHSA1/START domain